MTADDPMGAPLRILWLGAADDSPVAAVNRCCVEALARRHDVRCLQEGPADVAVLTDGRQPETPAPRYLHMPLSGLLRPDMLPAVGWLPLHRRLLPPNTPYLPLPDLADGTRVWDDWAAAFAAILHRLAGPPERLRLSACVLAGTDLPALSTTLANVRGFIDELIVITGPAQAPAVAPLAATFAARLEVVSPWSPGAGRRAAGRVARGDWILLLEAGEYLAGGQDNLRRISQVPPQGQDVCLLDLHDGLAGELGALRAPRLLANHQDLTWREAVIEGVERPPGGVVIESLMAVGGVSPACRPELRGASAASTLQMLHRSLAVVPAHPQMNRFVADLYLHAGRVHAANRHYAVTMAGHGVHGSWPQYVKETAITRLRIAWEQGFFGLLGDLLAIYGHALKKWAPFWLYRGLLDRREGRLPDAAGAVAMGWSLTSPEQFTEYRRPFAMLAAACCAETGHMDACVAWLAEAVKASVTETVPVAGWCRWVADRGHGREAQQLATAQQLTNWESADPQEPDWPQAAAASPTLTVCVLVDGSQPLAERCLPMFSQLADDLIVAAPLGSPALVTASAYAARCFAIDGEMVPAAIRPVIDLAAGDWVMVVSGHEWPDVDSISRLRAWLAAGPDETAVALDLHPVIEWPQADAGLVAVPRLAPRQAIRHVRQDGGGWSLESQLRTESVAGAFLWREGAVSTEGPAALAQARTILGRGQVDEVTDRLETLIRDDQHRPWPAPWLWLAWEILADVHRLQGHHGEATECLRQVAQCRPVLVRPGLAAAVRAADVMPAMPDPAGLPAALAIVQAFVTGRVREAVHLAEQAVQERSESAAFWGLLAQVRLEASDLAGAESAVRRCLLLRPRVSAAPEWFPDLGTMPEAWLGRILLAGGEPRRALGWLVPLLNRPYAQIDWAVFALAAAWQAEALPVAAQIVDFLADAVDEADRPMVDALLASAAAEYGWPAGSLAAWTAWLQAPVA
jgi:hypothetical protein